MRAGQGSLTGVSAGGRLARGEKLVLAGLLALLFAAGVWWTGYFPYEPERMYGVFPGGLSFLSEHDGLGLRVGHMAASPPALALLNACGVSSGAVARVATSREFREWSAKLMSRRTVFAQVNDGLTPGGAWLGVSWVGRYGQKLKLLEWFGLLRGLGLRRAVAEDGRVLWQMRLEDGGVPAAGGEKYLSLALAEGLLLAGVSADPLAALGMVRRLEAGCRGDRRVDVLAEQATAPDRGYLVLDGSNGVETVTFGLTRWLPGLVEGSLGGSLIRSFVDHTLCGVELVADAQVEAGETVGRLVGDVPAAGLKLRGDCLQALLVKLGAPSALNFGLSRLRREVDGGGAMYLFVLGGEYSGQVVVRVPAFVLAVRGRTRGCERITVQSTLDALNTRYGWGLAPKRLAEDGGEVTIIDSTRSGFYANLDSAYKPALIERDGWLFLSSSATTLLRLMAKRSGGAVPAWADKWRGGESGVCLWMDLVAGSQAMDNAVSAYRLTRALNGSGSKPPVEVARAQAWLKAATCLSNVTVWVENGAAGARLAFQAGSCATAASNSNR